ncbi:MAG: hypothetical protein NTZ13_01030 [Candidatus Parcubacteria bacterium]|nr:hypothetical protein [Candidatus Parcubacteria bacterium]
MKKPAKYAVDPCNTFIKVQLKAIEELLYAKNGSSLNPSAVVSALQDIIKNNFTEKDIDKIPETLHLHLLSKDKKPKISACVGGKEASLAFTEKTFTGYLDYSLKEWGLDTPQVQTKETEAEVWGMDKNERIYCDPFLLFNTNPKNLMWNSQKQIEQFCIENPEWFEEDGHGYYFLFLEAIDGKEEFFRAFIQKDIYELGGKVIPKKDRKLKLCVYRGIHEKCSWIDCDHRIVVPATWRLTDYH